MADFTCGLSCMPMQYCYFPTSDEMSQGETNFFKEDRFLCSNCSGGRNFITKSVWGTGFNGGPILL